MSNDAKTERIIRNHIFLSMAAGAIPVPLVDFGAVTAIQLDMLQRLCSNYGIDYKEHVGKTFITAISGTTLARYGASMLKVIPGIGSILGGLSMSIMSGASTYAVGQVCVNFLKSKSSLENFDKEAAQKMYKEEFEKGKEVVKKMEKEKAKEEAVSDAPETASAPKEDIYTQLTKLGDLKDKNIITQEEFDKMKKDLIERM